MHTSDQVQMIIFRLKGKNSALSSHETWNSAGPFSDVPSPPSSPSPSRGSAALYLNRNLSWLFSAPLHVHVLTAVLCPPLTCLPFCSASAASPVHPSTCPGSGSVLNSVIFTPRMRLVLMHTCALADAN